MPAKPKFSRILKVPDLIAAGVPVEVIPTYCCLADHANNKTVLYWPTMERLAAILNRSVRTIQRHLQLLKEKGLTSTSSIALSVASCGLSGCLGGRSPSREYTLRASISQRSSTLCASSLPSAMSLRTRCGETRKIRAAWSVV